MRFRCYIIFCWLLGGVLIGKGQSPLQPVLDPGVLLDTVQCLADPSQSYALYLPKGWNNEQAFPILYFFEPMARGKLPVEKYQEIADANQLILVGSHNSRNGSWEVCFEAADALFADTWTRLYIDTNQVFASGFSGGARVATAIGLETGKLNGVIGVGAGFPTNPKWFPSREMTFPFAGIVGSLDMNWLEMHDTETLLDKLERPNRLILHDGPHQWPEPEFMAQALDFLHIQVRGESPELISTQWANTRKQLRTQQARKFEENNEPYLAWYQWKNLHADFHGLNGDENPLPTQEKFKKAIQEAQQTLETEREAQAELSRHFLFNLDNYNDSTEFSWWELKGKALTRQRNSKNPPEAALAERLTRVVAARALESPVPLTDYPKTISLYKAWALVEPEKVWPHYRLAIAFAGIEEDNLAIASLKNAIKNGLTKKIRLSEPKEFGRLKGKKKFVKLMEGLE